MQDFQHYQAAFTAHIRNPQANAKPFGVSSTRMAVYKTAVFNNIFESVSVCFPVCQLAVGKQAWCKLIKDFVKNDAAATPIFREIPQAFLQFLNVSKTAPDYLAQLAHYEWVELAVSHLPNSSSKLSKVTDLLHEKPVLAPNLLLQYDYAVHTISKKHNTQAKQETHLLVFRNAENAVKFIELNPITFQLLDLMTKLDLTGKQALLRLAEALNYPDGDAMLAFGAEILADLVNQQAIIGSVND